MNLTQAFERYIGVKEYNGIVGVIQTWFYGTMVRAAWCATSMSYFANECGILDQLGGKNEGVWEMYNACKVAHKGGTFYDYGFIPSTIPKGAVCFFLRNGASHVTTCYEARSYTPQNYLLCLGGNQNDSICAKNYHMQNLQAIFIPDYGKSSRPVIKKGYKDSVNGGTWCVRLQEALNQLNGAKLDLDGSCGAKTDAAIRSFQAANGLAVDGSCGPKTWAKIDELLAASMVYVPTIVGAKYRADQFKDGYAHIPQFDIWVKI